jgi:hypothetical protein
VKMPKTIEPEMKIVAFSKHNPSSGLSDFI